jgi:hypothetical protein
MRAESEQERGGLTVGLRRTEMGCTDRKGYVMTTLRRTHVSATRLALAVLAIGSGLALAIVPGRTPTAHASGTPTFYGADTH